ncbi:MAG: translocation/assembly module TamB domain-containing protein [Bacillota bacterium]
MRRPVARFLFVFLFGLLATVLGIVTSLTLTPPGRALLARNVSALLNRTVHGSVEVGSISGSFLYDLTLEHLVVRDTAGVLLADLPRVRVGYRLPNLIRGNIVLSSLHVDNPTIQIIKHRNGRMNYEDVLGLGRGPKGASSPLIAFNDVRILDGTLSIAMPWNPPPGATPAQRDSALTAERAKPGRAIEETRDGLSRVIVMRDLSTVLSRLQISTPDRKPFTIDIDTLATRISDPAVTLTDAAGRIRFHGDSAIFSLRRGAMPNSVFSGGGAVTWPRDTVLFDFQMDAPKVSLTDLRWVSPLFPAMTGRGTLVAKSESGALTAYTLRDMHLRNGNQRVDGEVVALQDRVRGIGVRDMNITLANLDLDAVRGYVDTLPFYGTLSGTLQGSGFLLERLRINVDWAFADAKVPGRPVSLITADGTVGFGGGGLTFYGVNLRNSDIDLGTARRLAPAVVVPGRLAARGTLNGPLRNVVFRGTAIQRDGQRPPSVVRGRVHLDTRGKVLALETDIDLDPLSFEGIRRGFPSLKSQGEVRGHVNLSGTMEHLAVDATLAGQIGQLDLHGGMTIVPPRLGADALQVRFRDLDLNALRGSGPVTRLNGNLTATGTMDTLRAPEGQLLLSLSRSRMREWTIDTVFTRLSVADSVIHLDTLYTEWKGARAGGSGTLGWVRPHDGTITLQLAADSLTAFDSLALAMSGQVRDSSSRVQLPLSGVATARVQIAGSLDTLRVNGEFGVHEFAFQNLRSPSDSGTFSYTGGTRPLFAATLRADSLAWITDTTATGRWQFTSTSLAVSGRTDSLGWSLGSGVGGLTRISGTGSWIGRGSRTILGIDTLALALPSRGWRLSAPTTLTLGDSAPTLGDTRIEAADGSGVIRVAGRLPKGQPGDLTLDALGVDLRDVYDIMGRDTSGIAGSIGLALKLRGTDREPIIEGTASLADARFGASYMPHIRGVLNYADRRLDAHLLLSRTGDSVLLVDAQLPIDLGLTGVKERQLDGPIAVRVHADSMGLGILEALTPGVRNVTGFLTADARIQGTWKKPELAGFVSVANGGMDLPDLGVRYDGINGRSDFGGDSAAIEHVRIRSGGGDLDVHGIVRLQELNRPILTIHMDANGFEAINERNFLKLLATGHFDLDGPFYGATFSGTGTADEGALYFADLLNKRVIDLDDPTNIDLVDTVVVRRRNLRQGFSSRFMEELAITDFNLTVGHEFWLRSTEANIQLAGDVRVNKRLREYRVDGVLETPRGTYTLKIGPVSRDFDVTKGSVQYFGTPDLNAKLDIEAQHVVHAANGMDIPVVAKITGTLLRPKLDLSSGPNVRPPLPEVDLVSYLLLGVPASQAQGIQQNAIQNAASILTSAVSSDLERALVSDVGLPVDLLEIRPALAGGTVAGGTITQLAAGWQIGPKLFFRLNAGFCNNQVNFGSKNLGASVDFRFGRAWKLQASVEPTFQTCRAIGINPDYSLTSPYQIGLDVLWDREF